MPAKIQMFLNNGNNLRFLSRQINNANLATIPSPKAPSALNANIISRIHSIRPGCGSCGRH
jgi:hypothetical protein